MNKHPNLQKHAHALCKAKLRAMKDEGVLLLPASSLMQHILMITTHLTDKLLGCGSIDIMQAQGRRKVQRLFYCQLRRMNVILLHVSAGTSLHQMAIQAKDMHCQINCLMSNIFQVELLKRPSSQALMSTAGAVSAKLSEQAQLNLSIFGALASVKRRWPNLSRRCNMQAAGRKCRTQPAYP